jgi:hypothetical protein
MIMGPGKLVEFQVNKRPQFIVVSLKEVFPKATMLIEVVMNPQKKWSQLLLSAANEILSK